MAKYPDAHAELGGVFLLLTEALIESSAPVPARKQKQERIERLAQLEKQMTDCEQSARMSAVRTEMGIGRSYYFELKAAAIEQSLLAE